MPVFRGGAALVIKRRRAALTVEQLRLALAQRHRLIGIGGGEGDDPHLIEQTVKAVGRQQLRRQAGVDVLGIVGRLEDQRLAVHIAHAREAVNHRLPVEVHDLAHLFRREDHAEIHQRGRRRFSQLRDLGGEGVLHALAAHVGIGHKGALAALAHDKALLLQRADGLADGVAADVKGLAQLRLGREQRADLDRAGGDAALDDPHQLGIEGDLAFQ